MKRLGDEPRAASLRVSNDIRHMYVEDPEQNRHTNSVVV
jgi:hypothetical protein